jgi:hypothetical protein
MLIAAKVTDPSKCTFGKRTDIPGMGQFDELSKLKVLSPPSPSSDAAAPAAIVMRPAAPRTVTDMRV